MSLLDSKCPTYRLPHIWTTFGNSRNFQSEKSHISLYILKISDFETSKIRDFEQILSIFYSFLEMNKIAQYFDYIDLRPSKGSRNQRSSSKDLPQSPLLSVAGSKKRQKRRKNTKNEPLLGPRARNIHISVARREGPLKGPHQKWSKRAQNDPKSTLLRGREPSQIHSEGAVWR